MSIFSEEKPLIYWERYVKWWIDNESMEAKDHFMLCNKEVAFKKIGGSSIVWWDDNIEKFYQLHQKDGVLDEKSFIDDYDLLLQIRKAKNNQNNDAEQPLIYWERESNVWLIGISDEDHFKIRCTKSEALLRMHNSPKRMWGQSEEALYNEFKLNGDVQFNKIDQTISNQELLDSNDHSLIYHKFLDSWSQSVNEVASTIPDDVKDNNEIGQEVTYVPLNGNTNFNYAFSFDSEPTINSQSFRKKKKLSDLFAGFSFPTFIKSHPINKKLNDRKIFNIEKIRKPKNKKKIKKNLIKVLVSVLAGITIFSNCNILLGSESENFGNDFQVNYSILNQLNENLRNNSMKQSINKNDIIDETEKDIVKENGNAVKNNDSDEETRDKKKDMEIFNDGNVYIDDKITIEDGSKIYVNIYNASKEEKGLNADISSNKVRNVSMVGVELDGNIIYSCSNDEIESLLEKGANIMAVGVTNDQNVYEGFYNINDVIKVKTKKIV